MHTITKWLLKKDETGGFSLEEREVNIYIPVNRILDEVGYYEVESITVDKTMYVVVYNPKEAIHNQSKILITKAYHGDDGDYLVDLKSEDYQAMKVIAKHYLGIYKTHPAS
jgi:hypothetical protein